MAAAGTPSSPTGPSDSDSASTSSADLGPARPAAEPLHLKLNKKRSKLRKGKGLLRDFLRQTVTRALMHPQIPTPRELEEMVEENQIHALDEIMMRLIGQLGIGHLHLSSVDTTHWQVLVHLVEVYKHARALQLRANARSAVNKMFG